MSKLFDSIHDIMLGLRHALVWIVLAPVMFYRKVISPMKSRPTCRYLPTCSEYAIDAVTQRGVLVGSALAVGRILRCNPLFHAGFDPVPKAHARCTDDHAQELR